MCQHIWTCRHVLFVDMCQHVASLPVPLIPTIWTLSACWHVPAHMDMPTCAICRYVPTCSVTLGTSDTNHLDLICMLVCVSTYGHADMCWYVPTCVGMCQQHVTSLPTPMIPIILTLSACCHVSAHMWTCQHVTSLPAPLKRIIWTLSTCWHLLWPQQDSSCVNLACTNNCQRCPEVPWVHWLLSPFYQGLCQSGSSLDWVATWQ